MAIRYARGMPTDLAAHEIFRDSFFPVCSPAVLARGKPIKRAADLLQYPLICFDWMKPGPETPNWRLWLATANTVDPEVSETAETWSLSLREELHAIDAVLEGQGVAICSDVVVGRELERGTLVKAHDLSLPGYGYYLVHLPGHAQEPIIGAFSVWMRSVI